MLAWATVYSVIVIIDERMEKKLLDSREPTTSSLKHAL